MKRYHVQWDERYSAIVEAEDEDQAARVALDKHRGDPRNYHYTEIASVEMTTPEDQANAALIAHAVNNFERLLEACRYPRHGDTAKLLEMAADHIDQNTEPGWQSYFTPHLRNAAKGIREAIRQAEKVS